MKPFCRMRKILRMDPTCYMVFVRGGFWPFRYWREASGKMHTTFEEAHTEALQL